MFIFVCRVQDWQPINCSFSNQVYLGIDSDFQVLLVKMHVEDERHPDWFRRNCACGIWSRRSGFLQWSKLGSRCANWQVTTACFWLRWKTLKLQQAPNAKRLAAQWVLGAGFCLLSRAVWQWMYGFLNKTAEPFHLSKPFAHDGRHESHKKELQKLQHELEAPMWW